MSDANARIVVRLTQRQAEILQRRLAWTVQRALSVRYNEINRWEQWDESEREPMGALLAQIDRAAK